MQHYFAMGDDYQNEDYQRDKILEKLSHTSEASSELRKTGSSPITGEETQEDNEYIPDPKMLMRKLPKKGLRQGLFASSIDKWKEWSRSPINFAYGLALLSLIMAITAFILALLRCFPSCPFGWHVLQEKCYYYSTGKDNWANARSICHDLSADLVVIGSEEEQDFLVYNIPVKSSYWIGYSVLKAEEIWRWVDGSDSSYTYWASSQPDRRSGDRCVVLADHSSYQWNAIACSDIDALFICEKYAQPACVWHHLHSSFN